MLLLFLFLLLSSLRTSNSIHSFTRSVHKGQGQGHGQGQGTTTLDQTARTAALSKARALDQQKLQSRLAMQTQQQMWAKQQARFMATAEAKMAAKEHVELQQDAQAHATSEAAIYAQMDHELKVAQSAASANTPSLTRNPRLAKKHRAKQYKSKQAILLEQMLTPEQVEARNELERVARMTRRAAKMPAKEEERIEDNKESVLHSEHKPNRATPPSPLSFLQTNAAAPSWWPHAQKHGASSSTTRPTN